MLSAASFPKQESNVHPRAGAPFTGTPDRNLQHEDCLQTICQDVAAELLRVIGHRMVAGAAFSAREYPGVLPLGITQ